MKVALYARVSTTDQNCERQLTELREYCARRKWDIADEYVDQGQSGAKSSRPELNRCMADARKRRFDVVIVWALDRWGRSVSHVLSSIAELGAAGVGWMSYTQNLDTSSTNPTGQLLLTILGAVAQFEREMIRERVNSGLASARRRGRVGGRPVRVFRRDEATRLRTEGKSWREIARILDVPQATVRRGVSKT